jgi:hypothetical protein
VPCLSISDMDRAGSMIANPHKQQIPPLRSSRDYEFFQSFTFTNQVQLAAQVDESYFGDWLAEEVGAETLEFFDGVGGVEETVLRFDF